MPPFGARIVMTVWERMSFKSNKLSLVKELMHFVT